MSIENESKVNNYLQRLKDLRRERENYNSWWDELAYYSQPHKQEINAKKIPGTRLPTMLYDSTMIFSNQILAAGLHSYLTNPASKWFMLTLQNKNQMDNKQTKVWLEEVTDRMFGVLNTSNFNQEIHETYLDLGSFGTAMTTELEDDKDFVRFNSIFIEECYIAEDHKGIVNTLYRVYKRKTHQIISQFGFNNVPKEVQELYNNKKFDQDFEIVHIIEPREVFDRTKKDSINKPFKSVYLLTEKKHILTESGFDEFPVFVPRFSKLSGRVYGFGPAMNALPNMKMLNAMYESTIRAAQKAIDPPLIVPNDGYILPFMVGPAAINYKDSSDPNAKIEQVPTSPNVPYGFQLIEMVQNQIQQQFFTDMFMALQNRRNMTATEVQERVAEKMLMLGPTLGRLMTELLDPIIYRTFNILLRNNQLPPVPSSLEGQQFVVEYLSPLAKAQKAAETGSINNLLAIVAQMAQYPQFTDMVFDNIDIDKTVNKLADSYGVPATMIRSSREVEQIRMQRMQAMQAQQQDQQILGGAEVTEKLSKAEKNLRK